MRPTIARLDVRSILARGEEPFPAIMAAVAALAPGQGLALLAPFKPMPLLPVMERKGFRHRLSQLEDGDFEVLFMPAGAAIHASEDVSDDEEWPEPALSLDLSTLEPSRAARRLLKELEFMAPGEILFAVLAGDLKELIEELGKAGHKWVGNRDSTGMLFRMMIKRGSAPDTVS